MIPSGITNDNKWQRVIQQVTTSDNKWYSKWQWMTAIDNEWERVIKYHNEWWRMTASVKTHEYEWENVEGKSEEVKRERSKKKKPNLLFLQVIPWTTSLKVTSAGKLLYFLNVDLYAQRIIFFLTKVHHLEPFKSLFYMLFRMCDMGKEFSWISLHMAVHYFE